MRFSLTFELRSVCITFLISSVLSIFPGFSPFNSVIYNEIPPRSKSFKNEALYLTPYIKNGRIKEARNISRVNLPDMKNITANSGYFTVDERYNSNMFFWFVKCKNENLSSQKPVILWLQGSNGFSSLLGLFMENGPFYVNELGKLEERKYSWHAEYNILYIDNPVGVGFSFANDEMGYSQNQTQIGKNLYEAASQFFYLFPEFRNNSFYLAGESYAGKYIPSLAAEINRKNLVVKESDKINLKGLMIGNGLTDPEHMMKYSEYWYQLGFYDKNESEAIAKSEKLIATLIRSSKFEEALEIYSGMMRNFVSKYGICALYDYTNLEKNSCYEKISRIFQYLQRDYVKNAIHVGSNALHYGDNVTKIVEKKLKNDIARSVGGLIPELLQHQKILFFNGQLSAAVPYPAVANFLRHLEWEGAYEYSVAKSRPLFLYSNETNEPYAIGNIKYCRNLTEVVIRNVGHFVGMERPQWILTLVKSFINDN